MSDFPFVQSANDGTGDSWVVLSDYHAVKVDSERIRRARWAINTQPPCPTGTPYNEYERDVMVPLRDELRDATTERTNQLLDGQS